VAEQRAYELLDQLLGEQLEAGPEVRLYRRLLAVRAYLDGESVAQIAQRLDVSRQSVYNWIRRYEAGQQPVALVDRERSGRPATWTRAMDAHLHRVLQAGPPTEEAFASQWTVPLLQQHFQQRYQLQISQETIRRALHRLGYGWKRYRYVLEPDAELEKKTRSAEGDCRLSTPYGAVGTR
jgi:transposase